MLELLPETTAREVLLRLSGRVSRAEQDALFPELEDLLESHGGPVRALFEIAETTEMEPGVKSEGLWLTMRYRPRVERLAVVASAAWEDEVVRLTDIYSSAEVRRFDAAERAAALDWLRGD